MSKTIIKAYSDTAGVALGANNTSAINFDTYSDARLKENIFPLSGELDKIMRLNPVSFNYIGFTHLQEVGFIAQELETVYPDSVSYVGPDTEEMKVIGGWSKTDSRIIKAIQELSAKVDSLQSEIDELKGQ